MDVPVRFRMACCLLAAVAWIGCDSSDREPSCTPGASVECIGRGGCPGGQVCTADGRGFGECVCDSSDAASGDASVDDGGAITPADAGGRPANDAGPDQQPDSGDAATDLDAGSDAGSDAAPDDAGADAAVDFGSFDCNPLTHVPCEDDERCTWIDTASGSGTLSCLPDGAVSADDACTRDGNGVDDCARGLICIDGACANTCNLEDRASCAPGNYCVAYEGVYSEASDPALAGACKLGCDPVTQLTSETAPCGDGSGCYHIERPTHTLATCLPVGATVAARTQGVAVPGTVYANACAPGFVPMPDANDDAFCIALCTPVETWSGQTANIGGEMPHTCASRGAGAGYECRFAAFQALFDASDPLLSTIGLCIDPAGRLYDSNGNGTPETPWPSCAALANTDTDGDGERDHEKWGCAPTADP